jgi:6,7-dimethyl-8-ribityllumazine synthase
MKKIVILKAEFYPEITNMLLEGVKSALESYEVKTTEISVPGCFELPLVAKMIAEQKKYDGFISLGCVIRGATSHYDIVCDVMSRGLNKVAMKNNLPHGFGVVTVENYGQAIERASIAQVNVGKNAVKAVMKLIEIKDKINNDQ